MPTEPIRVVVTADDIAHGIAGSCFCCPVALALSRATGDDHANVYERDWRMWLDAHSRTLKAPSAVREFVEWFDALERRKTGRVILRNLSPPPCEFELPPLSSPEWQERCDGCEELFASVELDDDGLCASCREDDHAE